LVYEDAAGVVNVYDITYNVVRAVSKPREPNNAWSVFGDAMIIQMPGELKICTFPYGHLTEKEDDLPNSPFVTVNGLFISLLRNRPLVSTKPFARIFDAALKIKDVETLKTPILPYNVNALHYFVLQSHVKGIEFCFANGVKFIRDSFGKNPLDYAHLSTNQVVVDAVITGIYSLTPAERIEVLREIPFEILVEKYSKNVLNILQESGTIAPDAQQFGREHILPTNYNMAEGVTKFAQSSVPVYGARVASTLHPSTSESSESDPPVKTLMITTPVPGDFTEASLKLLEQIKYCEIDDLLKTKPILFFLKRKWQGRTYQFYVFQLLAMVTLLGAYTLCCLETLQPDNFAWLVGGGVVAFAFTDLWNWFDLVRLGTVFAVLGGILLLDPVIPEVGEPQAYYINGTVLTISLFLIWIKLLKYLAVFESFRYLIQMILEILSEIKTFMFLLAIAMTAYCQIMLSF
jgi:hypothetical protein